MYRPLSTALNSEMLVKAVHIPGHETRMRMPLFTDAESLASFLIERLEPLPTSPYFFYGHSLGSVVAYEIILQLQRARRPLPSRFFAAARRAPHLSSRTPPIHKLSDEDFSTELLKYEGTPSEIFENKELRNIFLPILRADFTIVETYTPIPSEKINVPVTVFGGRRDPFVTTEELQLWEERTTKGCDLHILDENHFFTREGFGNVAGIILRNVKG